MPSARVEPVINREGWFWEYFHETPPMSTFLVAFFIGNYVSLESEGGIKFWGAPEYDPPSEWLLEKGDIVFEKLQKILGPNPLPKQDVIAIPHFVIAKAVENWGLLSFKKELIVGNVTGYKRHDQLNIFAHELAHNWFGNLVSPTCWNDVWFSEGFATFYSTVVVNRAIPDWDSVTWDTVEHLVITWLYDSTLNPVPLVEPFRTKYSNFELIVYSKGYFVIRMVNLTIGNEVFDKAISQYLKNNQFGLFSAESLWNTIENTAVEEKNLSLPIPLHKIMKRWIELPGMPFIKVNRENNGTIIISQERYIKSSDRFSNGTNDRGNGDDEDEDYGEQTEKLEKTDLTPHEWWIPITVITGQNDSYLNNDSDLITPQYWLQPGQKLIINDPNPDHSSWILINPYSPVPCHIAYDEWNYDLLKTEDFHKIPTLTQVQILGDVSTLALDSLMNFTQALEITSKILNGKENYVFWRIGIPHLLRIYRILYGSEARTIFKEFIQKLTSSKYRQLRLANTENESVESELLRPLIAKTSCLVQSKDCINDAVALFNKWSRNQKLDSENKVTEEIKPIVYCTISEYGGVKGWSLLWSKLKLAKDHTERRYLIEGMACSKNTQQLNRFLMASINMTSSLQLKDEKERKSVLHSIVKNPVAVDVVLDFINDHKDEIKKAYSRSGRKYNWRKVSDNITPLIRNEEQLSKFQRFLMTSGSKNIRLQSNYMINSAKWAMQWRLNNTKIFKEEWLL
ncbi:aminopeptidase Ey-like [Lycorma delicatula]|uniref:aminopeptidase Ey-like n=1 Tax=Lycorma delicatula TaxID=130591 RepID=UPI003F50E819